MVRGIRVVISRRDQSPGQSLSYAIWYVVELAYHVIIGFLLLLSLLFSLGLLGGGSGRSTGLCGNRNSSSECLRIFQECFSLGARVRKRMVQLRWTRISNKWEDAS